VQPGQVQQVVLALQAELAQQVPLAKLELLARALLVLLEKLDHKEPQVQQVKMVLLE
jgi:hypothetical protein